MTDTPQLRNPRFLVVMADGATWTVQSLNQDMLRWESTATKHKWPPFNQTPMRWNTFLAYRASLREGLIPPDLLWEEFSENGPRLALSVFPEGEDTPVDPTRPVADTD